LGRERGLGAVEVPDPGAAPLDTVRKFRR
jgi:hypothetical protein